MANERNLRIPSSRKWSQRWHRIGQIVKKLLRVILENDIIISEQIEQSTPVLTGSYKAWE